MRSRCVSHLGLPAALAALADELAGALALQVRGRGRGRGHQLWALALGVGVSGSAAKHVGPCASGVPRPMAGPAAPTRCAFIIG